MGPEYYPPGGHDWVSSNDLRRARAHSEALLSEKYFHDVAAFRAQFFSKLTAYGAMHEGFGWAIFNGEDEDNTDTELYARRRVLLVCRSRPDTLQATSHPIPLIRLITNEPIISESGISYLAEDATVYENGRASYHVGGVHVMDANGQPVDEIKHVLTPLFSVSAENNLLISTNSTPVTPSFILKDSVLPDDAARPFGPATSESLEDYIYALENASSILQSVMNIDPSHTNGRVA